ncbi:MAG: tetratricopeptide repeat protein, partial [Phycisphaerae bacterium]|nr:tetratricopeptide repeat protein [Phycisphaerae bacterium]
GDLKSREAIPDVVRAIKSKDTKVRDAALYSLARIAAAVSLDDDTLDLLMELGSAGNTRALDIVRQYAPRDKAIEFMTYHLKSDNIPLRCIAMIHLVALKATEAADVIGKMTSHPRLGVRGRAIWAIGRLGQKQYISTLIAELHDRDILSGKGIDIHAWASGTSGKFWYLHPHAAAARPSVIEALGWLHATEAIPDLIHMMETHAHPGTRLQVAGLLQNWADLDDRIVPALVRFAEDVHPQTQLKVIDWLGKNGGKQAVPYLQRMMKGEWRTAAEAAPFALAPMEDRTIWSACVEALVKLGDTSIIPYLKKELKNAGDDEGKKSQIVSSLRRLGDAEGDRIARENFLRQLDSKDDAVVGQAALALANMGEESVIPKLKGLAKKLPANTPRLNVLKALVKLGHREGVGQLLAEIIANRDAKSTAPILASDFAPHINAIECIPAMNDRIINDEGQYHMRYRTALALCALGHPDGIPALVHRKIMKGPHAYGGAWIMEGLGNFKDKRVVRALVEFLEDKNDWVGMRSICAESLGRIGDPEAVPALINQLRDVAMRDHAARVRVNAAGALAAIGSMAAVGPLVEVAQGDRDSSVRRAAISALAKMKVPEAIEVSLEALKDESAYVRAAAAVSLNVTTGVDYRYFAEAVKAYPKNSRQLKTARKMVDQARRNDARIQALEKTITESPDNLDAYLELAELCEKLSMSNKAASVYRRYVRAAGDQAKAEVIAKVGRAGSGSLGGDGSWWLIGPFEWAGFSAEYPPQNKIKDEAYVGKGGVGISWRKVALEPDVRGEVRCDFGRFVPGSYVESVFFVYRTLSSDRERRLRLLFGSDDGIKVWFNGQEVISSDVYRAMQKDQEGAVVTFSKGANRLLIRINNGLYGGGFILRITDDGGKPVKVNVQGALL